MSDKDMVTTKMNRNMGYKLITLALAWLSYPSVIYGHDAETINTQNAPVIINSYNCASSCSESTETGSSQDVITESAECCNALEERVRDLEQRVTEHQLLLQQNNNEAAACDTNSIVIEDCSQLQSTGFTSGIQTITPQNYRSFQVYCETTDNVMWTVIQRRVDNSTGFHRNFAEYRRGFGNLEDNFWLGLEKMHRITSQKQYKLRIELTDWENTTLFAEYLNFNINDEDSKYQIRYDTYSGTAGDSFMEDYHNGMPFSTFDQDNDLSEDEHCAEIHGGGWWFNDCDHSNLNGPYRVYADRELKRATDMGIEWDQWKQWYSFKATKMSIAPAFGDDSL